MTDEVREHLQAQITTNTMQLRQLAEDMADLKKIITQARLDKKIAAMKREMPGFTNRALGEKGEPR